MVSLVRTKLTANDSAGIGLCRGQNYVHCNNFRYVWHSAGTHLQHYCPKSLQQTLKHVSLQTEQWEVFLAYFFTFFQLPSSQIFGVQNPYTSEILKIVSLYCCFLKYKLDIHMSSFRALKQLAQRRRLGVRKNIQLNCPY